MSNIKIINFNECDTDLMEERGFGGVRGLVKTKGNVAYLVKPENLNQTLNEVMAQIMIKSLGLTSIEYAFIKINETYYGALRYLKDLVQVTNDKFKSLSKQKKIEFLRHLFLNSLLANDDICGEIYLTPEGKVVSLDYGEAGVGVPLYKLNEKPSEIHKVFFSIIERKTSSNFLVPLVRSFISFANERYTDDSITKEDIKSVVLSTTEAIGNADNSEYESFLKDVNLLHGELIAYMYQQHLNGLIETSEYIIEHFNEITT